MVELAMVILKFPVAVRQYLGEGRHRDATRIPVSLSVVITTLYFSEGTVKEVGTQMMDP